MIRKLSAFLILAFIGWGYLQANFLLSIEYQ